MNSFASGPENDEILLIIEYILTPEYRQII
jgi:hypothetical protein